MMPIPRCLRDVWSGPKQFDILPALRKADVAIDEFDAGWKKMCSVNTEAGKERLVRLLKKARFGCGGWGDSEARLAWKAWFVNQVVGRDSGEPAPVKASNSSVRQVRKSVCLPVGLSYFRICDRVVVCFCVGMDVCYILQLRQYSLTLT